VATTAGQVGRVGAVQHVEVVHHLLGDPGGVRGARRLGGRGVGELTVPVGVRGLLRCGLDLLLGVVLGLLARSVAGLLAGVLGVAGVAGVVGGFVARVVA